jgi:ABC-2 type transport system ATP-binding protein
MTETATSSTKTDTATNATVLARGLVRRYGATLAVQGLTLELKRGEVLGLLGPNGAGKSTTLRMLTGNLAPSAGSISICGIDLLDEPKAAKAKIGYLPETPPLYKELTVDSYLDFCAHLHRLPSAEIKVARERAKTRCGLHEVGHRLIAHLSKGFQQRVGIAQAIIHQPDVVILDEPTVGLDPNQIREIRTLIRELGGSHSVILSTHILPEVEAVCDRVQIMHRGQIVFSDSIEGLKRSRQGDSLVVGLHQPPFTDTLRNIDGVTGVEALPDNLFRIRFEPGHSPAETLAHAAVQNGWGLTQLCPEHTSLEDVFVELTQKENAQKENPTEAGA